MKTLTLLTTATLLSISSMAMASADCTKPPLAPADALGAAIDRDGHATPTVVFQRGTDRLDPASSAQLAELAKLLEDEVDLRIQVGFAADGDVSPQLAQARAKALREALLNLDAPADRVAIRDVKSDAEVAKLEIADAPAQCGAPVAGN